MISLFLAYLLLAGGITANKYILNVISPEFFVALRMFISGLILVAYNYRQSGHISYKLLREDFLKILFISACTTLLPALLKAWALKNMIATKQTILGSIDPFVTAIIAYHMLGDRLRWSQALGMLLGLAGVCMIILSKDTGSELTAFWRVSYPELAVIAAVIVSRYGWMLVQAILRSDRYTPIQMNALVQVTAGLGAFGIALMTSNLAFKPMDSYQGFVLASLFTIFGGNVLGYTLYAQSLKHYSATLVSLTGFLIPLFVTIFAYLFLCETITLYIAAGGFCIFSGLAIFYVGHYKTK